MFEMFYWWPPADERYQAAAGLISRTVGPIIQNQLLML